MLYLLLRQQPLFSANFTVSSPAGIATVLATQGANSASKTFIVTSSLAETSLNNILSIESIGHQSNATLGLPPANQSNASVPIVTNSSFVNTKSNGSIAPPLNTSFAQPTENISTAIRTDDKELPTNTTSAQPTENILTAPSAKEINNTSFVASTGNTINNNPSTSILTPSNDTSNSKRTTISN